MGILKDFLAVELVGCCKGTLFHLVEDHLDIDKLAFPQVKVNSGPQEFRSDTAIETHGFHNTYYLYRARCVYHLVNSETVGMLEFRFEGVVMTDADDLHTDRCDLHVELERETCHWLTEPIVQWFQETVSFAVAAEFDRFIKAGDLDKAKERIEQIQSASDEADGFLGMYL